MLRRLRYGLLALQLTLPKIGIGFMFAILTSNFNRITIHELGIVAVLITSMIGVYHFLSPFQVVLGRMTDRYPIFGFRRSPYLLLGLLSMAIVFPALPGLAVAMSQGSLLAVVTGFVLLAWFGMAQSLTGAAHLALIADVTSERSRGVIVALVWTVQIIAVIASAVVMKIIMPHYDQALMQQLYNLVIPVTLISTVLALIGTERRMTRAEAVAAAETARASAPQGNVITLPLGMLRADSNVRNFFFFIFFSTLGVFLQDSLLEVFGAEVFQMTVKETTSFQQLWGGGVLLSMLTVGAIVAIRPFSRRTLTLSGSVVTAAGLVMLAATAMLHLRELLNPSLLVLGIGSGIYTTGALTTMMEMSTEAATATYMGLWGMAQAIGNGSSSVLAGTLHTALIESGLFSSALGYGAIFSLEGLLMLFGAYLLLNVNVAAFREGVTRRNVTFAMEMGSA